MILRRINGHVKDQNWFAVGLDFLMVVAGILIAFQITNWNEARATKRREQAMLLQLEEEFIDIESDLEKQISIRQGYVEHIGGLIAFLEGEGPPLNDLAMKTALDTLKATGRRPAQSAAYLQLMASGDLTLLSNEDLQKALVRYDSRLQRDAFIHPELMKMVMEELTSNIYVDYNFRNIQDGGAAIDNEVDRDNPADIVRSYDLDGLKKFEKRYETIYLLHIAILNTDILQLELAAEILQQISGDLEK